MTDLKIHPVHLERAAYVYIRQSTMHQVRHNKESQSRQYALPDHARQLGFTNVVVIDDDLGRSGAGQVARPGFGKLLTCVCEGTVGAVFAIEASRLARNNRDWHHLLDLCAMTDTLVIDENGIYNPRILNDRLLLGLQGTMSEFELGLFQQRSREALLAMIRRGMSPWRPATGYIRTEELGLEMTPDRQVQQAIQCVFEKFQQFGSARQVLLWYLEENLLLPRAKPGSDGREVDWLRPRYPRIICLLRNPIYAGAFVYGRAPTRLDVKEGRAKKARSYGTPIDKWQIVIHDHHPGYISWDEYLRILDQLKSNISMHRNEHRGSAKNGAALLVGLMRCARCGRKLHVTYAGHKGKVARYCCKGGSVNYGTKQCISVAAFRLDQQVSQAVLDAVQPLGVEASLAVVKSAEHEEDQKLAALELALEKARYEANRVKRQFDAVEPENRLVAAELENRWNQLLQRVTELERRVADAVRTEVALTVEERERLLAMGQDLTEVWKRPAVPTSLKKRIIRTVLEEIVVDILEETSQVRLHLHWVGGVHTELIVTKNRRGHSRRKTGANIVDLTGELAKICPDRSIAAILNRLGYRTGPGNTWTAHRVASLRNYHGIPVCTSESRESWCTLREASQILEVSHPVVHRLIQQKILPATQIVQHAPWMIQRDSLTLPAVQAEVRAIHAGRRRPRSVPGQLDLPLE